MLRCVVVHCPMFRRIAVPSSTGSRGARRVAAREDGVCYVGEIDDGGER